MTLIERYAELLSLTKHYLQQDYSLNERILSEEESYNYFKAYALNQQTKKTQNEKNEIKRESIEGISSPPPQASKSNSVMPNRQPLQPPKPIQKPAAPTPRQTPASTANDIVTKTKKEEKIDRNKEIALEVPPNGSATDFSEMRKIIQEKLPQMHANLIEAPPDDTEAKKLAKLWTLDKRIPQVLILAFDEIPKHQAFLINIGKALEAFGISSKVESALKLEHSNSWQGLLEAKEMKLVLASGSNFHTLNALQKFYREDAKQGRHFLGKCSLLLLSDISFYLKEPALKPTLWAAIKELA